MNCGGLMNRLILFLIRRKLGVKKYQSFQFNNQVVKNEKYYIDSMSIKKITYFKDHVNVKNSNLKVNFLLSKEAKERLIKL